MLVLTDKDDVRLFIEGSSNLKLVLAEPKLDNRTGIVLGTHVASLVLSAVRQALYGQVYAKLIQTSNPLDVVYQITVLTPIGNVGGTSEVLNAVKYVAHPTPQAYFINVTAAAILTAAVKAYRLLHDEFADISLQFENELI